MVATVLLALEVEGTVLWYYQDQVTIFRPDMDMS